MPEQARDPMTSPTKAKVASLYARFGPTIYARCRRLLKNPATAEDATQEVFLKVLKHIQSAPNEDAVLPWIHRITTNHCLNLLRDNRRQAEPVAVVPEQRDDDFEDSVVTKDFASRVLAETPEEEKTPAMLYHLRGMEQSKVAAALGVSRRTVLYRLSAFAKRAQRLHDQAEAGLA
jgi:RNA polymerase sigma-70 factor, ECF subfamily